MSAHKITKTSGEWLGSKGEQTIALKTKLTAGERVVAMRWPEGSERHGMQPGDLELKHITGDAYRKPEKFVEHDRRVIPNGTDADIDAYIAERLGA